MPNIYVHKWMNEQIHLHIILIHGISTTFIGQIPKSTFYCLCDPLMDPWYVWMHVCIFTLQKKIIRIMVGAQPRTPCRSLFKKLQILPIICQYIFLLINFILNNQEHFQTNTSIHSTDTAISTTCIDQMPTYLVFKTVHSMPVSQFSIDFHWVS
jgi:hypothetical protein